MQRWTNCLPVGNLLWQWCGHFDPLCLDGIGFNQARTSPCWLRVFCAASVLVPLVEGACAVFSSFALEVHAHTSLTPSDGLLSLLHLHLLDDLAANITVGLLHLALDEGHEVPGAAHLDVLDQYPRGIANAHALALDFGRGAAPHDAELGADNDAAGICPRLDAGARVLEARGEDNQLLGPVADAGDEGNGLGDIVGGDGILVGRVPVRVFERCGRRRVGFDVAGGEGLERQARVVVVEGRDDVVGRQMSRDRGGDVEVVFGAHVGTDLADGSDGRIGARGGVEVWARERERQRSM